MMLSSIKMERKVINWYSCMSSFLLFVLLLIAAYKR